VTLKNWCGDVVTYFSDPKLASAVNVAAAGLPSTGEFPWEEFDALLDAHLAAYTLHTRIAQLAKEIWDETWGAAIKDAWPDHQSGNDAFANWTIISPAETWNGKENHHVVDCTLSLPGCGPWVFQVCFDFYEGDANRRWHATLLGRGFGVHAIERDAPSRHLEQGTGG
jgi:hypothetical protein